MENSILFVIFVAFWIIELNAFVEQRAALEVGRRYSIPVSYFQLPSWFPACRYIFVVEFVIIGYAFWKYPWYEAFIMLVLYFFGNMFVPIPASRYAKYISQLPKGVCSE